MFLLPRLPQLSAAIALVGGISQQLQERKAEALAQISSAFEDLEQALQQRKQALVSDLEAICGAKQKVRLLAVSHLRPSRDGLLPSPPCHTCAHLPLASAFHLLTWSVGAAGICPLSILTLWYFFHAIVQAHQESQEAPPP